MEPPYADGQARHEQAEAEAHPIEETGRQLRGLMSWVSASDDYTGTAARG